MRGTMEKARLPELPPPGAGLATDTFATAAIDRSDAAIEMATCVALTNVVLRALPFHFATEFATNPVPVIVSVNPALATGAESWDSEVAVGAGFPVAGLPSDAPPPPPPPQAANSAQSGSAIAANLAIAASLAIAAFTAPPRCS
jgi:hypothetical protein